MQQGIFGQGVQVFRHDIMATMDQGASARGLDQSNARSRAGAEFDTRVFARALHHFNDMIDEGIAHEYVRYGFHGLNQLFDGAHRAIGEHVCRFLMNEMAAGRIPPEFLPLQSGVGNVCNAVMGSFSSNPDFPRFKLYTEVLQDAMVDLIGDYFSAVDQGKPIEYLFDPHNLHRLPFFRGLIALDINLFHGSGLPLVVSGLLSLTGTALLLMNEVKRASRALVLPLVDNSVR